MLKNLYEWYRIVTPKPDDDTIRHRQASIPELIDRLARPENSDLLIGCVAAAAAMVSVIDLPNPHHWLRR